MYKKFLIVSIFSLIFYTQCKHEVILPDDGTTIPPDTNQTTDHPCDPDTVYFVNTIEKLINSQCAKTDSSAVGCHSAEKHAEGITLNSYANIMLGKVEDGQSEPIVIPGDPDGSDLLDKIEKNEMPPYPNAPLTADEKAAIRKWIEQGAKNNYCTDCDSVYTYSEFVESFIASNCKGCHNSSNPSGGILLENFTQVQSSANSILSAIKHEVGFTAMPYNSAKLSACEIHNFETWVNEGMQNN